MGADAILELPVTRDVVVAGPEGPAYDSLRLPRPAREEWVAVLNPVPCALYPGGRSVSSVPPPLSFAAPMVRRRDLEPGRAETLRGRRDAPESRGTIACRARLSG